MENIPRLYKLIPKHPNTYDDYEPARLAPISTSYETKSNLTDDTIIIEVPDLNIPLRLQPTYEETTIPQNVSFLKYGMRKNYVDTILRKYETLALFGLDVWRLNNAQLQERSPFNVEKILKSVGKELIESVCNPMEEVREIEKGLIETIKELSVVEDQTKEQRLETQIEEAFRKLEELKKRKD